MAISLNHTCLLNTGFDLFGLEVLSDLCIWLESFEMIKIYVDGDEGE